MSFLSALSDDQKALLGCIAALTFTSILLVVSNFIGNVRSGSRNNQTASIPLKKTSSETTSNKKAA